MGYHDHYELMIHEVDTLKVGIESLHRERDKLVSELTQARRDLAEIRERLEYHQRRASIMATAKHCEAPV